MNCPLSLSLFQQIGAVDLADGEKGLGIGRVVAQHFLHPDHIVPGAEFIAALVKGAHQMIAQMLVKIHAPVGQVRIFMGCVSDAGVGIQNVLAA